MDNVNVTRAVMGRPEASVLAIDASRSMEARDYVPTRLDGAKAAASVFLRRKPLIDRRDVTAVVVFSNSARQVSEFGLHPVEAERLLRPITASGNTSVVAGLELALGLVMTPPFAVPAVRRCVLLSDGHHNLGQSPVASGVLARLRDAKVVVDCVAMGDADERLLQAIARETGGRFERCGDVDALRALYDRFAEKIATP